MNLRAKKKWGQNFLVDANVRSKIVEAAGIDEMTLVIEIGPGQGAITELISHQCSTLLAYEIDPELILLLKAQFKGNENVLIKEGDFLLSDVNEDIKSIKKPFNSIKVVANLPYYITSPIISKLLLEVDGIDEIIIMVQYEVAVRLTASVKNSDYRALSVITNYYAQTELLFKVPPQAFKPQPQVDSAVLRLKRHDHRLVELHKENEWVRFIRFSFQQPRKTLINNLTAAYPISKEKIASILESIGLAPSIRAESLEIVDLVKIFDIISLNI
jgi:16S rRNA (adenine1518-N6/adenine1519-N6)-dimethyltransferase